MADHPFRKRIFLPGCHVRKRPGAHFNENDYLKSGVWAKAAFNYGTDEKSHSILYLGIIMYPCHNHGSYLNFVSWRQAPDYKYILFMLNHFMEQISIFSMVSQAGQLVRIWHFGRKDPFILNR